jgi:AbrB family looped-hinge helix DNA binding protein
MKVANITTAGQISIPAAVRRRWGTKRVAVEDHGDHLVVTPFPDDPIAAARGILKGRIGPTEELRAQARRDEEHALRRRGG